ncbi:MAG: hypothetical protein HC831_23490 [Chloroflexia bacterium]|nr:hypothetical protein [Chloroflexia bacterium]
MNIFSFEFILAAVLIFPLFQTNGYCRHMGIIDPATTYVFFYALPVALLLLYFAPLFLKIYYNYNPEWMKYFKILWLPLALIVSLSGPLNPGVSLIIVTLISARIINKKLVFHTVLIFQFMF